MFPAEGTKSRALREAKGLLQVYGFNGFSFQQIADEIGIKKPSLYEHFKSKEDLGLHLVDEYHRSFENWANTVEVFGPTEKIGALFEMFFNFSTGNGKFCPLSAFIADFHSLPKGIKKRLTAMFDFQRGWLDRVIREGQKKKIFANEKTSSDLADFVISIAFGAQSVARITKNPDWMRKAKIQTLALLEIS